MGIKALFLALVNAPLTWKTALFMSANMRGSQPKGLRQLLQELGLYKSGMKRRVDGNGDKSLCMTTVFNSLPHIQGQPSILSKTTHERGHVCLMLPKFHCELNPMERRWGKAKAFTRRWANGRIDRLRFIVLLALSHKNIPPQLTAMYERKSMDYATAYIAIRGESEGASADEPGAETQQNPVLAEARVRAMKKYRSHRGVPPSESSCNGKTKKPWENVKRKRGDSGEASVTAAREANLQRRREKRK